MFGLGLVGHIFARASEGETGVFGSSDSYRNYLAVTGACQMMRKEVFRQLGGYDERFRLSFSDVVLCMEAWKAGYRVVYTPYRSTRPSRIVHEKAGGFGRKTWSCWLDIFSRAALSRTRICHPELDPQSLIPALRPPFDPQPRQVIRDYVERVLAAATP